MAHDARPHNEWTDFDAIFLFESVIEMYMSYKLLRRTDIFLFVIITSGDFVIVFHFTCTFKCYLLKPGFTFIISFPVLFLIILFVFKISSHSTCLNIRKMKDTNRRHVGFVLRKYIECLSSLPPNNFVTD